MLCEHWVGGRGKAKVGWAGLRLCRQKGCDLGIVMQTKLRLWGQNGCCRGQGPCPDQEGRSDEGLAKDKLAGSRARLRLCGQRMGW